MDSPMHKRMKTCHPEDHYDSDEEDAFAYGGIFDDHGEDKYGSVTKECNKVLSQILQLETYLRRMMLDMVNKAPDIFEQITTYSPVSSSGKAILAFSPPEEKINIKDRRLPRKGSIPDDPMVVSDSDEEAREFIKPEAENALNRVTLSCPVDFDGVSAVPLQVVSTKTMQRIENVRLEVDASRSTCGPLVVKMIDEGNSNGQIQPFPYSGSQNSSSSYFDDESDSGSMPNDTEEFNERHHHDDGVSDRHEDHSLDELWKEVDFALEYSKENTVKDTLTNVAVGNHRENCKHGEDLIKDDVGLVCLICGLVKKSITDIFEYQWRKSSQCPKTQTYWPHKVSAADKQIQCYPAPNCSEDDFLEGEILIHPLYLKKMKPHQIEGFGFIKKNLMGNNPRGCILAHAPGSGKTLTIISFIQSFLSAFPSAKPLIVLPKGILPTWKMEFKRWQIEDIILYDLYSTRADGRSHQLEILNLWAENKSVLLMGYKQFTVIISEVKDKVEAACRDRLLTVPSLLILDEGHALRNEYTEVLSALAKVHTPRKVVLSGTLFQNKAKEVFNILNLVHPNFLRRESSRSVVTRVLGRSDKSHPDSAFFEKVESILQNDNDPAARIRLIKDLKEITKDVLHYHKGHFSEDLPGLEDFTVMLKLTSQQRDLFTESEGNERAEEFKRMAEDSCVFLHPCLKGFALQASGNIRNRDINYVLDTIDVKEGVKTKFVLDIISLADSAGERVLVFSQYILPLRFLERLVAQTKGWRRGKEIFSIFGDTTVEQREQAMESFNTSSDSKVLFGSIKACGEGISLVGASRVVILDVHFNPSVSKQAIARAFRPGQTKKVVSYRLVAADSPEERRHGACVRKEVMAKMWFEWDEWCGQGEFELESVRVEECGDLFLVHHPSAGDIKALYRRRETCTGG